MTLTGKGFFLFNIPDCDEGNPGAILGAAKSAGLSHILVKIADGIYPFGIVGSNDVTAPVVKVLRSAGIPVWGWHYIYGNNPAGEAAIAISRCQELGLDGYVVDAEEEFKKPGKDTAARQYMNTIRSALKVPIALSSYRFPNYHQEFPWSAFLEKCDYMMPQMYWEQAHNAGWQLRESKRQCDALPNARPYIPTGATYGTPPIWEPTPAEVSDFLTTARTMGLPAVNFFDWDYCRMNLPQVWETIASFSWTGSVSVIVSEPEVDIAGDYLAALNSRTVSKITALYDSAAVYVRGGGILSNMSAIQSNYSEFFASLAKSTVFSKVQVQKNEDLWQLSWKAGNLLGETTLIVKNGKITVDYTYIL